MRCPACGFESPPGARRCGRCGAELYGDGPVPAEAWRRRRTIAAEALRETLAGLTSLGVQVEPVNADAERDGLTADALLAEVVSALREAGLAVATPTSLVADVRGTPFLHVDVMTVRLDGRYAYVLRLELWQGVSLVRDPRIRALAVTWTSPALAGTIAAERLGDVRHAVRAAVDGFVADWRAARGHATGAR